MRPMKPSGISWIGSIPRHWGMFKQSTVVTKIGSGKTPLGGSEIYVEDGAVLIRSQNVYDGKLRLDNAVFIDRKTALSISSSLVKENDVLLNITGASIGRVCVAPKQDVDSYVNQHVCIIRSQPEKIDHRYLFYLWASVGQGLILYNQVGATREAMNFQEIGAACFPYPPLGEQRAIASFLDGKCSEIDALHADLQAQIRTLSEYKHSLITETVTRGLNPDVPMKESGIPWIGEVPAHWSIKPAKFLFGKRSRLAPEGLPHLTPSQKYGVLRQEDYWKISGARTTQILSSNAAMRLVKVNDFIIHLRSFQGGIELSTLTGKVSPAYTVLIPRGEVYPGFFRWRLKEQRFIEALNSLTDQLRDGQNISYDMFATLKFAYPCLKEQEQIASYLDEKCSEIDALIAAKREQLETLTEYRKALIYEYVTGKKETPAA